MPFAPVSLSLDFSSPHFHTDPLVSCPAGTLGTSVGLPSISNCTSCGPGFVVTPCIYTPTTYTDLCDFSYWSNTGMSFCYACIPGTYSTSTSASSSSYCQRCLASTWSSTVCMCVCVCSPLEIRKIIDCMISRVPALVLPVQALLLRMLSLATTPVSCARTHRMPVFLPLSTVQSLTAAWNTWNTALARRMCWSVGTTWALSTTRRLLHLPPVSIMASLLCK